MRRAGRPRITHSHDDDETLAAALGHHAFVAPQVLEHAAKAAAHEAAAARAAAEKLRSVAQRQECAISRLALLLTERRGGVQLPAQQAQQHGVAHASANGDAVF